MHQQTPRPGTLGFVAVIAGLTVLCLAATITIGYLVTSAPRGFMFWIIVGFLCTVEFLAGILIVNNLSRARCEYRPSGAVSAITQGAVGGFALTGLISIIIYQSVRDSEGTGDGIFAGVLVALTVLWFAAATLIYARDIQSQKAARPTAEKRSEHGRQARTIRPVLASLRAFNPAEDEQRRRLALLVKRLETIETALAHSHGGGAGSWESGPVHPTLSAQDAEVADKTARLGMIVGRMSADSSAGVDAALAELESCAAALGAAVRALELG